MKSAPWSLAGRLLVRDWRSGEVIVLLAALVVAVAAISAVTFFTDRVRQTMAQQAGETLAADLRVESTLPLPEALFSEAAGRGLETARIVHFRSVVLAGESSALADVRGATGAATLGDDNRIVDGEWWAPADTEPQVSIEVEELDEMGLELGDTLTYSIGGQEVTARITSARRIEWDSFRPNFFMVLSPGSVANVPHTYITSFHVPPERRDLTLELARRFPSVSIIDIDATLEQVRSAMDRAAVAVQYVFLFTLAAGLMVLLAAIQSTRDERMFESAVLRTLGARRAVVLQGVAAEFAALRLLAGTLAAVGAGVIGFVVAAELFELDYAPGPGLWLVGVLAGTAVVGVSGTLAVRSVVNHSPVATLRGA